MESIIYYDQTIYTHLLEGQTSELYCGGQHAVDVQRLSRTASVQLKDGSTFVCGTGLCSVQPLTPNVL